MTWTAKSRDSLWRRVSGWLGRRTDAKVWSWSRWLSSVRDWGNGRHKKAASMRHFRARPTWPRSSKVIWWHWSSMRRPWRRDRRKSRRYRRKLPQGRVVTARTISSATLTPRKSTWRLTPSSHQSSTSLIESSPTSIIRTRRSTTRTRSKMTAITSGGPCELFIRSMSCLSLSSMRKMITMKSRALQWSLMQFSTRSRLKSRRL